MSQTVGADSKNLTFEGVEIIFHVDSNNEPFMLCDGHCDDFLCAEMIIHRCLTTAIDKLLNVSFGANDKKKKTENGQLDRFHWCFVVLR